MDKVHIKHDLVHDKREGCLVVGFIILGSTNNQLIEFENALCTEKSDASVYGKRYVKYLELSLCSVCMW